MEILSHGARIEADPLQRRQVEAELARLRAQVTWLQAERAALWWAVGHDELTGLANRRLFQTLAPPLLREWGRRAAVIVIDLNGFKPINDRFGHDAGDDVLRIVAQRIAACVGDDLAARLGGDEFAAVVTNPHPDGHDGWWQRYVGRLAAAIGEPMPVAGHTLTVTASIGIAPARGEELIGELLRQADQAMYRAKIGSHRTWGSNAVDAAPPPEAIDGPLVVELAVFPVARRRRPGGSAPAGDPAERDPAEVAPASAYQCGDPVWVYRYGAWRPGVVEGASARAVMATYRCTEGRGTVVDTMSAEYVMPRGDVDAQLDAAFSAPDVALSR
jgi:diguanylate cyclase (GGDEF)-like protein